jgi:hypothetical protein
MERNIENRLLRQGARARKSDRPVGLAITRNGKGTTTNRSTGRGTEAIADVSHGDAPPEAQFSSCDVTGRAAFASPAGDGVGRRGTDVSKMSIQWY